MGTVMKNLNRFHFHWSSEVYNYGLAFRKYYKLPRFLPLPFYSDHGVLQVGVIDANIIKRHIPKSIFLTFSPSIMRRQQEISTLKILGTLHPWVYYKEEKNLSRRQPSEYILFFPMHTLPGYQVAGVDDKLSVNFLVENSSQNLDTVVCLHWNDFASERKDFFENNGFKVVMVGKPFDKNYLDEFYRLAAGAKFAIAESWTSAIAYLVDFGVPCTIIKRDVKILNLSKPEDPFDENYLEMNNEVKKAEELFASFPPVISENQIAFVRTELGYQYRESYEKNRRAILGAYYQVLPSWALSKSRVFYLAIFRKLKRKPMWNKSFR
jgi:hypothetical protein